MWKLLLSHLGLFREMFGDLRGEMREDDEGTRKKSRWRKPEHTTQSKAPPITTGSSSNRQRVGLELHTHASSEGDS